MGIVRSRLIPVLGISFFSSCIHGHHNLPDEHIYIATPGIFESHTRVAICHPYFCENKAHLALPPLEFSPSSAPASDEDIHCEKCPYISMEIGYASEWIDPPKDAWKFVGYVMTLLEPQNKRLIDRGLILYN